MKPVPQDFGTRSRALRRRIDLFSAGNLFSLIYDELNDLNEPERSNFHSFIVNLYSYAKAVSPDFRPMDIETIFRRSMTEGPKFAKWLDGAKSAWLGYHAKRRYYSDEIYENYKGMILDTKEGYLDISGIYRSNSLYFWTPEKLDLRQVCFRPVTIDPESLGLFRRCLRRYLERPGIGLLKEPDWKLLTRVTDKGTLEGKNYQEPRSYPARLRGRTRIAHVARELKAARAAPVNDYSSGLTIRWIDAAVAKITSFDNRDTSRWEAITLKRTLERNIRGKYSYCRDFNKEGLTKPREILEVMLEELYEATNWGCFRETQFFNDWEYEDDGEIFHPPRGHGLGCANALTTLMSIIIEEMIIEKHGIKPDWSGYNNDDAATTHKSREAAEIYGHHDRKICESLSLDFKPKASFISKHEIVLCEQYACTWNRTYGWKGSYYQEAFYNLLKCRNVAHAQYLARTTDITFITKEDQQFIMDYWGYALFRNEQARPQEFGGWFTSNIGNVIVCLADKDMEAHVPREEHCAISAFGECEFIFRKWDKRKVENRLYHYFNNFFLDEISEEKDIWVRDISRPSMDAQEEQFSWDKFLEKLKKSFAKHQSLYDKGDRMTYFHLYQRWLQDYPGKDIIPPKGYQIEVYSNECATKNKEFWSPYSSTGFLHDLFLFERLGTSFPYYSRSGKVVMGVYKSPKSSYRDAIKRTQELFPFLDREWETYLIPPKEVLKNMIHPFEYTRACDLTLEGDYRVVIPKENDEERKSLLKQRSRIYKTDLEKEWWWDIGSLKPADILIPQIVFRDLEDLHWGEFTRKLRQYPNFGAVALDYSPSDWPLLFSKYKKAMKRSRLKKPTTLEQRALDQIINVPRLAPQEDSFYEEEDQFEMVFETEVEYQDQLDPGFYKDGDESPSPPGEPPDDGNPFDPSLMDDW
jgi:hypothetical protein